MSADFVLMTDSSCDLPYDFYSENNIAVVDLSFIVDGVARYGKDATPKEFYDLIRAGKMPSTSAVNTEDFKDIMEPLLKEGKDILYIAFSSGLSATCKNGEIAANELKEVYPERKIVVVDSLCASMGQGLFVYYVNKHKQEGMSLDELAKWAMDNRLRVAHYFTADDLMHLHRGGRVSKASAIAGTMLGIKPLMYVDNEGRLIPIAKLRGKKQLFTTLVDRMEKAVGNTKGDYFMVSHADCVEDAKFVAELVTKRFGIKNHMINYIGPVIGSHTGIGTIALFLMADHR